MNFIDKIKNNQIHIPIWLGQILSYIPYPWRPVVGKQYSACLREIKKYESITEEQKKSYIFQKTAAIVNYAYNHIHFYHQFYDECNFSPKDLTSYEDLSKIPVINKDILMRYSLEERSNKDVQHYVVNTGGSSGKTLTLCSQRDQMAIESAHCHTMYSAIGYKPSDLKMSIVGRKTRTGDCEYDFARHILFLNMYLPFKESATSLKKVLKKYHIRFIQGYPSILYEFAVYCQTDNELLNLIKKKLRGVIFNSEYPYPKYISLIEDTFGVSTLSFYGHTERCVLAHGDLKKKTKYYPFQTYGYTEAIADEKGHSHLVGTSYYNYASPLIRYDTEDIISNLEYSVGGVLKSFEILEGRSGQYILDKSGEKISLTGLIMGRHHPLFNHCMYIQVYQSKAGEATILFVPKDSTEELDASSLVDLSNVDIDFRFERRTVPIRTVSGKVNLLVKKL